MEFDTAITDELLATTRAVRKRLDTERAVPREVILECLQLATQAPTGSNRQTWRWIVIDDPAKKRGIADLYRRAGEDYFRSLGTSPTEFPDDQAERVFHSWRWLMDNLERIPTFVIPCVEGRVEADASLFRQTSVYGSIFPAVWSFQLALRSRGLGSTLTTLHLQYEAEAAALLGLPETIQQVALVPVAYTRGTDFKRAERPPVSTITHWNGW